MKNHYFWNLCFLLILILVTGARMESIAQSRDGRLPGTSMASYQLQKDTLMPVLGAATLALKGEPCKQVSIPRADLLSPPQNPVFKNGVLLKGPWREKWTVKMCDKTILVPITFIPDGRGGTSYSIKQSQVVVK